MPNVATPVPRRASSVAVAIIALLFAPAINQVHAACVPPKTYTIPIDVDARVTGDLAERLVTLVLDLTAPLTWAGARLDVPPNPKLQLGTETWSDEFRGSAVGGVKTIATWAAAYHDPAVRLPIGYDSDYGPTLPTSYWDVHGALGMGWGTSFWETAAPYWTKRMWALRLPLGKTEALGEIACGFADPRMYTGAITYVPALGQSWNVSFDGITATGARATTYKQDLVAWFDATEKTARAPRAVMDAIYGNDPRINKIATVWTMPCGVLDNTKVRISLGGTSLVLSNRTLVRPNTNTPGECIGNFAVGEFNDVALGLEFIRRWYLVFDASGSTPRVGFAKTNATALGRGL